jgi:hypothetical protein
MHRFLYLARPRADLTLAQFQQCWREHSRLAATCPDVLAEIRGYRQWQVVTPGKDNVVGVAETRCADAAAVYRMLECAGTRDVLQPDELRFFATPCRGAGLVADDTILCDEVTAGAAFDHGCLWLAPRVVLRDAAGASDADVAGDDRSVLESRIAQLRALFAATTVNAPRTLSLGWRNAADAAAPFAAMLFARFDSAAAAAAVAAAWHATLGPGENVWQLQCAPRHLADNSGDHSGRPSDNTAVSNLGSMETVP